MNKFIDSDFVSVLDFTAIDDLQNAEMTDYTSGAGFALYDGTPETYQDGRLDLILPAFKKATVLKIPIVFSGSQIVACIPVASSGAGDVYQLGGITIVAGTMYKVVVSYDLDADLPAITDVNIKFSTI